MGLSISEFARREGCSRTLVQRKIASGHLKAEADGTVSADLVGTGWCEANRRKSGAPATPATASVQQREAAPAVAPQPIAMMEPGETPAEAALRIVSSGDDLLDMAEAERLKENYLGRLKQLEYDLKSGAVVPASEVTAIVGAEYAAVRTRLLAIPAEQAPRLQRCRTVAEVQDALMTIVVQALEHLTRDREPAHA